MRRLVNVLALGLLAGCGPEITDLDSIVGAGSAEARGNGAPSGAHFNLNVIGVPQNKDAEMTGGNGHRIFVPLQGNAKIYLAEGAEFQVVDANGTDGNGAQFRLPNPDADDDGTTTYSVWARALGTPGGMSTTTTCATDVATGDEYCSLYSSVLVRGTGNSRFKNVSQELLYVYADVDGDGSVDRFPLFDSEMEEYFWNYDNAGLRLAQLRFYPLPSTVP